MATPKTRKVKPKVEIPTDPDLRPGSPTVVASEEHVKDVQTQGSDGPARVTGPGGVGVTNDPSRPVVDEEATAKARATSAQGGEPEDDVLPSETGGDGSKRPAPDGKPKPSLLSRLAAAFNPTKADEGDADEEAQIVFTPSAALERDGDVEMGEPEKGDRVCYLDDDGNEHEATVDETHPAHAGEAAPRLSLHVPTLRPPRVSAAPQGDEPTQWHSLVKESHKTEKGGPDKDEAETVARVGSTG